MNRLIGKVLWWDARDGQGIVIDTEGNEYYIDSSVIYNVMKSGIQVSFLKRIISGVQCGYKVTIL